MISCPYCGYSHQSFQPKCSSCGAPMQAIENRVVDTEKTNERFITEKIHRVCRQNILMYNINVFLDGATIPEKKLQTIKKYFKAFPNGKEIYFYCDTTPFNNGKQGLMICENGVYWQNSWVKPTNRNFLSWNKFMEREISLEKYNLNLGEGDIIDLAGLGRDPLRKIVEGIFQRIQKILKENI